MITVENVMSVIDIDASSVSEETKQFLKDNTITYRDCKSLGEHLYNVPGFMLDIDDMTPDEAFEAYPGIKVFDELLELDKLCCKYDAAYVRLLNY